MEQKSKRKKQKKVYNKIKDLFNLLHIRVSRNTEYVKLTLTFRHSSCVPFLVWCNVITSYFFPYLIQFIYGCRCELQHLAYIIIPLRVTGKSSIQKICFTSLFMIANCFAMCTICFLFHSTFIYLQVIYRRRYKHNEKNSKIRKLSFLRVCQRFKKKSFHCKQFG